MNTVTGFFAYGLKIKIKTSQRHRKAETADNQYVNGRQ
jgi:hypothetical protein